MPTHPHLEGAFTKASCCEQEPKEAQKPTVCKETVRSGKAVCDTGSRGLKELMLAATSKNAHQSASV